MAIDTVSAATQLPWSTIITATISSFTALAGAFGGAFLANRFAENRWAVQDEHDRGKERTRLLKEKGEELFLLLKKWQKEIFFTIQGRINELQGYPLGEESKKFITSYVDPSTHGKVDVIVAIYFPELSLTLEELHDQINKLNKMHKKAGLQNPELAKSMIAQSQFHERIFEILYRKIIQNMKNI